MSCSSATGKQPRAHIFLQRLQGQLPQPSQGSSREGTAAEMAAVNPYKSQNSRR